ncbi:MAG TPA: type II toxin-antitoxin system RelE/ParE family toxin [Planctomycetaceae bacterium]|nr:type II toxin-antitoxin system RelE/ParE family toxin [Planctomycetaceae bacterium]
MRVSYHPAVERELIAAAEYYEVRQSGLGFSFRDEFQQAVKRIISAPHRPGEIVKGVRGIPLHRFPYWVYYRLEPDKVHIIVLRHRRRDLRFGLDRE